MGTGPSDLHRVAEIAQGDGKRLPSDLNPMSTRARVDVREGEKAGWKRLGWVNCLHYRFAGGRVE